LRHVFRRRQINRQRFLDEERDAAFDQQVLRWTMSVGRDA
jgi:hypothetical protein